MHPQLHDLPAFLIDMGGFQLEFVRIIRVINHVTCYNWSALIGENFIFTRFALQSDAVISFNESTQIYSRSCDL